MHNRKKQTKAEKRTNTPAQSKRNSAFGREKDRGCVAASKPCLVASNRTNTRQNKNKKKRKGRWGTEKVCSPPKKGLVAQRTPLCGKTLHRICVPSSPPRNWAVELKLLQKQWFRARYRQHDHQSSAQMTEWVSGNRPSSCVFRFVLQGRKSKIIKMGQK